MSTVIKNPVLDRDKPSFAILTSGHSDGLSRSGTGCFIAVFIWQQWASKG